jgi:hypothetical protein
MLRTHRSLDAYCANPPYSLVDLSGYELAKTSCIIILHNLTLQMEAAY